jgi:hypothetical protein
MTPLELLLSIRREGLADDAARILFAVEKGVSRYGEIRQSTGLEDFQTRRMIRDLKAKGWLAWQGAQSAGHGGGSGRVSHYSLTEEGVALLRRIRGKDGPA